MSAHPSNAARGAWGERLAATHYRRRGYDVVDRNWRSPTGELDLVLRRGELYVFSEVKTRRTDWFGPAAGAVGVSKQRRIRRLAVEWLRGQRRPRRRHPLRRGGDHRRRRRGDRGGVLSVSRSNASAGERPHDEADRHHDAIATRA